MHGTGEPLGRFSYDVPVEATAQAKACAEVLAQAQRVLILGHRGADGDVAGSSLGLAAGLRTLGKDVVVYNELPYPKKFAFMAGFKEVRDSLSDDDCFDATVVVDAADPERCGKDFPEASRRGTYLWVDHHRLSNPPGDINYIDLTAAAVGEQIVAILDAMNVTLDKDIGDCIYTSLLTDTGAFRYGNTSCRAFELASRLVRAGVEPWDMTQRLYESQPEAGVRLLGQALSTLERHSEGRVGLMVLTDDDIARAGADEEHVHGIVNHARGIEGVELAILLRQQKDVVKATVRSKGNIQAAPLAAAFGAMGKKNAASFKLKGQVADVRKEVARVASVVCEGMELSGPARVALATPSSGVVVPHAVKK